jgi:hypothetical protein
MTIRDREVLDVLGEDPELLAIADAVVETQRIRSRFRPWGAVTVVALAAALFLLVLASPWDRGGGNGGILDRALAAIETRGPVVHMTIRLEPPGSSPEVTTETFYDRDRRLVRVVSRSEGSVVADYTTRASEDEFVTFPGLLDGAAFYLKALSTGAAKVVGRGTWQDRPVYWIRLEKPGGLVFEIGIDRDSYRPVVFRGLNPDRSLAGFQAAVLGLDYVQYPDARFQPKAPVLVRGTVLGEDCRPIRARVGASLPVRGAEIASGRSGPDGRFTLRVDPGKSPFDGRDTFKFQLIAQGKDGFGFASFWRAAKAGRWWNVPSLSRPAPITIRAAKGPAPSC